MRQWPDVICYQTRYARAALANWSGKLDSKIEYYRWLITRTNEQKLASIRDYTILSYDRPALPNQEARTLRSLNRNLQISLSVAGRNMVSANRPKAQLKQIMERLPGTPVADLAAKELAKRKDSARAPASQPVSAKTRPGTASDKSGPPRGR